MSSMTGFEIHIECYWSRKNMLHYLMCQVCGAEGEGGSMSAALHDLFRQDDHDVDETAVGYYHGL